MGGADLPDLECGAYRVVYVVFAHTAHHPVNLQICFICCCGAVRNPPGVLLQGQPHGGGHPQGHEILPFAELYAKTGCQFQPFNSIYQLYADKLTGRLEDVTDFLMIPEHLLWRLCGVKAKEYTNATTTGMVSAETGEFDPEIISALGLPPVFPKLQNPGTILGEYDGIKCVLCATHDTASAVEGISMAENAPYISSGTWSLLGVKTTKPLTDSASCAANYSNEGGVGYNRYQKNIMGMWLVNELQKELCSGLGFAEIVNASRKAPAMPLSMPSPRNFWLPRA